MKNLIVAAFGQGVSKRAMVRSKFRLQRLTVCAKWFKLLYPTAAPRQKATCGRLLPPTARSSVGAVFSSAKGRGHGGGRCAPKAARLSQNHLPLLAEVDLELAHLAIVIEREVLGFFLRTQLEVEVAMDDVVDFADGQLA